jgi:hypothetical protein
MTVWGTFTIDAYRDDERREVYDALESLFGPTSGTGWSTAGIYVYWDFSTREILYVGLASDPRFASVSTIGSRAVQIAAASGYRSTRTSPRATSSSDSRSFHSPVSPSRPAPVGIVQLTSKTEI